MERVASTINDGATRVTVSAVMALLALLSIMAPAAEADAVYTTKRGKIPSGGHGGYETGDGARIANKAKGYYLGWVATGSRFTRVGGRLSHKYGQVSGPGINICGWVHNSALRRTAGQSRAGCSKALANQIWQRTTFGQNFSTLAGTRKVDPVVSIPVKNPNCHLFYNYFDHNNFQTGRLRNSAGTLGSDTRDADHVGYRYQTRDSKVVVIRNAAGRWGFVKTECVDLTNVPIYNDPDPGQPPKF